MVERERAGVYAGLEVDVEGFGGWFEEVACFVEGFGQVVCVGGYACVGEDVVDGFARVGCFGLFEEVYQVGPGGHVGALEGEVVVGEVAGVEVAVYDEGTVREEEFYVGEAYAGGSAWDWFE